MANIGSLFLFEKGENNMAVTGPATGNYGRDSILAGRRASSRRPEPERLTDDPQVLGGHRATYDPVILAQRYSNDYQAEINRRKAIDPGDPTIAVLNDLRTQKLSGQPTTSDYGIGSGYTAITGGRGPIGNTGAITGSEYYDRMFQEQQDAIRNRINSAVDANNAYIPQINQQSRRALQNAYIANQQARVRTPQALNALGYSGGAAESTLLGLDTNYQNARGTIEQERSRALEGIRQNEAQIRSTGDATLADAAASYYDNLVTAAQQAEARAQDQANWESEFALQEKQYSDAAAQQAWQNAYDERMFQQQYSPQTQANYAQAAGANADASRRAPTSSGNYNTVWANVQRALGGSNAGSQRSFDAVINYIQNSLRSGMITENEAQQMLGRLNL
jgi:hypothetical protein